MKTKIVTVVTALLCLTILAQEVDEAPMRDALDKWHEYYHVELHKTDTNNPALGLAFDGYNMLPNTRRSQLRYFDRKVCRLFAGITNGETASNFVWQVNEWTTKPLPTSP